MLPAARFLAARDFLLAHRRDYETAYRDFRWPQLEYFNWALDYFDAMAAGNHRTALWIVDDQGRETSLSFETLRERSNRVANFLRASGVRRGDRVLVMLGNQVPLWETLLAACKLGAVVTPAATMLGVEDIRDRVERGGVRHAVVGAAHAAKFTAFPDLVRLAVGPSGFEQAYGAPADFEPDTPTHATDPLLLYFTSGTTSKPKLAQHSHESYPVGHLSTMYWLGLEPGDVHWNISSPGWAKHAWSCVFAPWNAGATVFTFDYARFQPREVLRLLAEKPVTTLCAPPTVWRMLVQEKLTDYPVRLREAASAGEPLNPEVIGQVNAAWGLTIRDGYGQTESTAMIGNSPGQPTKPGSMGRPLPGYRIELSATGEIRLDLRQKPAGLMQGYSGGGGAAAEAFRGDYYHTGDIASCDEDGYFTYIGRADDVFKASDYRISPFELESALVSHPAVAEAAVVPCPDPLRGFVPKAYVVVAAGYPPSKETARDIFRFLRQRLAPYQRIRRLEFAELPKTISGKIRRAELRRRDAGEEFREE
jgi:acetyl-CoA synthetase